MELNVIIEIAGQNLIQKPLSAEQFLRYEQRKTTQSIELANEWLVYETFGNDIDLSKLKFRDRGKLLAGLTQTKVQFNDDKLLPETSDFTVSGNRFTEKDDSGNYFDGFISKASKDAIAAYRWAIPKVLLMNGEEIREHHFSQPAPNGIGFEGCAVIVQWLSSFLI